MLRTDRVSPETANHDACRMEHTISEESFQKIQELVKKIKEDSSKEQMEKQWQCH
ncbi:MAG: iron dependent repressor, metal binding and dimerization domain protein [Roseburia sp.]